SITNTDKDWGWYNTIRSGSNTAGHAKKSFYTWTHSQAGYTINTRSGSTVNGVANARFVVATVNNIPGVILFPDSYTHPSGVTKPKKANINANDGGAYSSTTYTTTDWGKMEDAGAVFLPSAGIRGYDATGTNMWDIDKWGTYWTSSEVTEDNIPNLGGYLVMTETTSGTVSTYVNTGSWYKRGVRSVRLVLGNF
ncbi:MAG: hypothetical protein J6X35_08505, partial [Bacteroidales bacterium]|nr:hypothetical protein [Bacteroidales bacterium]